MKGFPHPSRGFRSVASLFAIAAAVLALLFVHASSADAGFVGVAEDPAGDSSDPDPARDITAFGLGYERRSGSMVGALRLRGAPSSDSPAFFTVFAGTRTGAGCNGYPAIGFGGYSDELGASWLKLAAGRVAASGEADKSGYLDPVQQFEITAGALSGARPNCVVAALTEPGNASVVYDVAGPIPLRPLATLEAGLGNVPSAVRPGQERQVKLTLRNPGDAPTGRVRLAVKQARGLSAKLPRSVASIAPGGRRTVAIRVVLGKRAAEPTHLRVTARAGKLLSRAEASLDILRPGPPSGGGGGDDDFTPRLCNRWVPDLSGETGGSLTLVPC